MLASSDDFSILWVCLLPRELSGPFIKGTLSLYPLFCTGGLGPPHTTKSYISKYLWVVGSLNIFQLDSIRHMLSLSNTTALTPDPNDKSIMRYLASAHTFSTWDSPPVATFSASAVDVTGDFAVKDANNNTVLAATLAGGVSLSNVSVLGDLTFENRPLSLGAETKVAAGPGLTTLSEKVPASFVHINEASPLPTGSNLWNVVFNKSIYPIGVHVDSEERVLLHSHAYYNIQWAASNADGSVDIFDRYSNYDKYAITSSYSPTGTSHWHRVIGSPSADFVARSVTTDVNNNVYCGGYCGGFTYAQIQGTVFDSNLEPWAFFPSSSFYSVGYAVKYTKAGTPCWILTLQDPNDSIKLYDLKIDRVNGYMYVVGSAKPNTPLYAHKTTDVGNQSNTIEINTSNLTNRVAFLMQFGLDGTFNWVNAVDGPQQVEAMNVGIDTDSSVVIVCRRTNGNSENVTIYGQNDTQIGLSNLYNNTYYLNNVIAKYDMNGNALWGAAVSGQGNFTVATDPTDGIYVVGVVNNVNLSIIQSDGTYISPVFPYDSTKSYVVKLDSFGTYEWSILVSADNLRGLAIDASGSYMYVTTILDSEPLLYISDGTEQLSVISNFVNQTNIYPSASRVLKFDTDTGAYISTVAHIENKISAYTHIRNIATNSNNVIYAAAFAQGEHELYDGSDNLVFANNDNNGTYITGYLLAFGEKPPPAFEFGLPRQYNTGFVKNIFVTSENVPFNISLLLQNADGSSNTSDVTLTNANSTKQLTYKWLGTEWAPADVDPTIITNGVRQYCFMYGDVQYDNTGSNHIGATVAWDNVVTENTVALRVGAKFTLASEDEVVYRQFDAIVRPADNIALETPKGIIVSTNEGTVQYNLFSGIENAVSRNSSNAVDVQMSWDSATSNYVGTIELDVVSSERLGDIRLSPL